AHVISVVADAGELGGELQGGAFEPAGGKSDRPGVDAVFLWLLGGCRAGRAGDDPDFGRLRDVDWLRSGRLRHGRAHALWRPLVLGGERARRQDEHEAGSDTCYA